MNIATRVQILDQADYMYLYIFFMFSFYNQPALSPSSRVFTNDPGDLGSILGRVTPKILKTVLDTSLHNTQHYKIRIKGKVDQSRGKSSALPYTSV